VLPDEVKNLPARSCFVKLCGNYPITKLKVKLQVHGWFSMFFYKLFRKAGKSNTGLVAVQEDPVLETPVAAINLTPTIDGTVLQDSEKTNILNNSTSSALSDKRQFFNDAQQGESK